MADGSSMGESPPSAEPDSPGPSGAVLICASLMRPDVPALLEGAAAARDADVVELRLDGLDPEELGSEAVAALVHRSPLPVIATCRPRWQGGSFTGSEQLRRRLLRAALEAGAYRIDVELEAAWVEAAAEAWRDRLILSHHWETPDPDPADVDARVQRLLQLRPAVGKLVAPARSVRQGIPWIGIARRLRAAGIVPACFAMGQEGRASRLLGALHGGLVYASPGTPTAPGQWPLEVLRSEMRPERWGEGVAIYAVAGDPVTHSLSPLIFNAVFAAEGRRAAYVPLPGRPFFEVLEMAEEAGVQGMSVTMPYKEAAAEACDERSDLVVRSGVANTLVRTAAGWSGHNTDGPAVVAALGGPERVRDARVVIVGAGGAARAAAWALATAGARLHVLNRTPERARILATEVGAEWGGLESVEGLSFDVLINATPVGMNETGRTPVSTACLSGGEVVMEMIYRPLRTELLSRAAASGCETVPGVEMFVQQAEGQYRLWFGADPPAGRMRSAVLGRLEGTAAAPGGGS